MLKKKDLIERIGNDYEDMLNQISIADFYKCIAQFSGLRIQDVSDESIATYLEKWAKNKRKFFDMMGKKVRIDTPITYQETDFDVNNKFRSLQKDFVPHSLWLEGFRGITSNKISYRNIDWDTREMITRLFPNLSLEGMTITRFFKNYLNAPDELVTKIAAVFENKEIKANYTMSIDPTDMMLASENPYNWSSCYRLENMSDSHADGCLAAILDSSSLITYIWDKEGDFSLYGNYSFKNVRYKIMRRWISIAPNFLAIHFNAIYPGKASYPAEFDKQLREVVEEIVSRFMGISNTWGKDVRKVDYNLSYYDRYDYCQRDYCNYGYGEYSDDRIYTHTSATLANHWNVYDEPIICPCGCGGILEGSESENGYCYNGDGFLCENEFEEEDDYYEDEDDYEEDYESDEEEEIREDAE